MLGSHWTIGAMALGIAITFALPVNAGESANADRARAPVVQAADDSRLTYQLQPGDVLTISVWKEKDLQVETMVRPDGGMSFPLAGDVVAEGRTIEQVRAVIAERLERFIPNPVVNVAMRAIGGNHVYVLGTVARPGEFPVSRPIDVMQALSLAGGATAFAAVNDIVILRRDNRGQQRVLRFRYAEIELGKALEQNVLLESGDTVVVP